MPFTKILATNLDSPVVESLNSVASVNTTAVSATTTAIASFNQANTATTTANTANTIAAEATSLATAAFSQANSAFTLASSGGADTFARETANAAFTQASNILTVTSVQIANSTYDVLDDTAANTSGTSYLVINGSGFTSNCIVIVGATNATSTTFANSKQLRANVTAQNAASYPLYVTDLSTGATAIKVNGLTFSSFPAWNTSATLTSVNSNTPFTGTLSAPSDSTVTYSNTTIMPTNTTLLSNGYYFGNVSVGSATNFTFDAKATDLEFQDVFRTFTLPVVTTMVPTFSQVLDTGYRYGQTENTSSMSFPGTPGGGTPTAASFALLFEWAYNSNTTVPSQSAPSGGVGQWGSWTSTTQSQATLQGCRLTAYYRRMTSADTGNIVFNTSASNKRMQMYIFREQNGLTNWVINPNSPASSGPFNTLTMQATASTPTNQTLALNTWTKPYVAFANFCTNDAAVVGNSPGISGTAAHITTDHSFDGIRQKSRLWVVNTTTTTPSSTTVSMADAGVQGMCSGAILIDPTPI
jgi:hypothetical protein